MAQSDQELSGTLAKLAITDPTEAGSTSVGPSHGNAIMTPLLRSRPTHLI